MSTLTKLALGAMGRLRPVPAKGDASAAIALPAPATSGGAPLLDALSTRASTREFSADALPPALLSGLLGAAWGDNRPASGGRTAPSAIDAQEIDLLVALPAGAYRYDAADHALRLVAAADLRRVTGYQDFVDDAALDLVFVADHARMHRVPVGRRRDFAWFAAGAIAQNAYLFCAANGLAAVVRAWIDRDALADALGLPHEQEVLVAMTIGRPAG